MKLLPYIGITGFARPNEVTSMIGMLTLLDWPVDRRLMVGVCASDKSLGGHPISELRRTRYPEPRVLENLFCDDPRFLNLVHFNSGSTDWTAELDLILKISQHCHGFQLNMVWPNANQLRQWRNAHMELVLVLQVGSRALRDLELSAGQRPWTELLVERLATYAGIVDYVLFDPSGGLGQKFDQAQMMSCLEAVKDVTWSMRFGVAGGLAAATVPTLQNLLLTYSALSWDAEGRLRGAEYLDPSLCYKYLAASLELIDATLRPKLWDAD